jgi:hypothetical protein
MFEVFLSRINKAIKDEQHGVVERMALGSQVEDYATYQFLVGNYRAYDYTLDIIEGALKRMQEPEFEGDQDA